jgi:hypothetical protein
MRWLGDELVGPLENARQWLEDNPCPDDGIGAHLRAMLVAYSEMPGASVPCMMELRDRIEQHARAIDRKQAPLDVDRLLMSRSFGNGGHCWSLTSA